MNLDASKSRLKGTSEAVQDYLKAIFVLEQTHHKANTSALAERLQVQPSSVTAMLKKMAAAKLVNYRQRHGAALSVEGRAIALQIVRHHRLLELFLVRVLGYPWEAVHDEAERLEHVISDRFVDAIADLLGQPDFDPHGHPIPSIHGDLPPAVSASLDQVPEGGRVRLRAVHDEQPELLRYLTETGLILDVELEVFRRDQTGRVLHVRVRGQDSQAISMDVARQLLVEPLNP